MLRFQIKSFSVTKAKDADIHRLTQEASSAKTLSQQIGARLNMQTKKVSELEATIKSLQGPIL